MGISLPSFSKLKSSMGNVATSPSRTAMSKTRCPPKSEKKELYKAKVLFQRNAPTEAELQQEYLPYVMELWESSDCAAIFASDVGCEDECDDFGNADETVENTRGLHPRYDMYQTVAPVRRSGGTLGSLADVQAQYQEDHEQIALFAAEVECVDYEVLFDAENFEDDAAPVVTMDNEGVVEQFKRLVAQPERPQQYNNAVSYNANRAQDFGIYRDSVMEAAVVRLLDNRSASYSPRENVLSDRAQITQARHSNCLA